MKRNLFEELYQQAAWLPTRKARWSCTTVVSFWTTITNVQVATEKVTGLTTLEGRIVVQVAWT